MEILFFLIGIIVGGTFVYKCDRIVDDIGIRGTEKVEVNE